MQTGLGNIERWARQNGDYLPEAYAEWQALIRRRPQRLRGRGPKPRRAGAGVAGVDGVPGIGA